MSVTAAAEADLAGTGALGQPALAQRRALRRAAYLGQQVARPRCQRGWGDAAGPARVARLVRERRCSRAGAGGLALARRGRRGGLRCVRRGRPRSPAASSARTSHAAQGRATSLVHATLPLRLFDPAAAQVAHGRQRAAPRVCMDAARRRATTEQRSRRRRPQPAAGGRRRAAASPSEFAPGCAGDDADEERERGLDRLRRVARSTPATAARAGTRPADFQNTLAAAQHLGAHLAEGWRRRRGRTRRHARAVEPTGGGGLRHQHEAEGPGPWRMRCQRAARERRSRVRLPPTNANGGDVNWWRRCPRTSSSASSWHERPELDVDRRDGSRR